MRRFVLLLLLIAACPLTADEVQVFAAVSLSEPLNEIATAWRRTTGTTVVFNFAGSNILARQIEEGAPADLFLSADEEKMDRLSTRGLIVRATRVSLLSNQLVVVVADDDRRTIRSARDLLSVRSLALAEPGSVPAGIYARRYLERAGVWTSLKGRVIPTENVRAALAAVAAGNAEAAIVYRTDVRTARRVRAAYEIPAGQVAISYPFARVREGRNARGAHRFLEHLTSPAAMRVFARHGFIVR